jgi:hypothetical protein
MFIECKERYGGLVRLQRAAPGKPAITADYRILRTEKVELALPDALWVIEERSFARPVGLGDFGELRRAKSRLSRAGTLSVALESDWRLPSPPPLRKESEDRPDRGDVPAIERLGSRGAEGASAARRRVAR